MKYRRVRITNATGRTQDTKVTDAETGEEIKARRVLFDFEVGHVPRVVVETFGPEVDVTVNAEIRDVAGNPFAPPTLTLK